MGDSCFKILASVMLLLSMVISRIPIHVHGSERCPSSWSQEHGMKFVKKVSKFWEFKEESRRWEEVGLPFKLQCCNNGCCSTAGTIERSKLQQPPHQKDEKLLHIRERRISVTKLSESSVWVIGPSGSIYERFWNGVQWVIVPRNLPISAGPATAVFLADQTIIALSESGALYELQLTESEQIWVEVTLEKKEEQQSLQTDDANLANHEAMKFLAISKNGEKLYFSSKDGMLKEINEFQPLRWTNYGRPPGGDVQSIVDAEDIRPGAVFTISSTGELFEFDKNSKPSWKKHIWGQINPKEIQLATSKKCCSFSLVGTHSQSLFLLSKNGLLLERQLQQRKWKWVVHETPKGHHLSSITTVEQDERNENFISMFFTTSTGSVLEYQLPKHSGFGEDNQLQEKWIDHLHPEHAKVARGVSGIQLHFGRMIFPLEDGRLAELHLSSIGGEDIGPSQQINIRRKATNNYEWSILDAPETEGWNAEYCSDKIGRANCIAGTKVVAGDDELDVPTRMHTQRHQHYLSLVGIKGNQPLVSPDEKRLSTTSTNTNFRMQALRPDRSFLYVSEGLVWEYQRYWTSGSESGLWLHHEHQSLMEGVVGNFNKSMYLIDGHGHLLIRERNVNGLSWIDCTNMRNGKQQAARGDSQDSISMSRKNRKFAPEVAFYFVSSEGRLLQFTVAFRMFEWKDCQSPPNTPIDFVVDQENFRMNIIFVVGRNGRLYQYNRVTELWHEHNQSPHLVLSRLPGEVMRPSKTSSTGSIFMILENGGLVEYHWNSAEGWKWVEHGTPNWGVKLVTAPGPCFQDGQLFLVGSDGHVYRRYMEEGVWKWESKGHPRFSLQKEQGHDKDASECVVENGSEKMCNEKVAAVRPVAFSEHSVIFELQDGRLAELRRSEDGGEWEWARIIGTPNSTCPTDYVMTVAL